MQVEVPGIVLVGTAHVSRDSVDEVREVVARVKPAIVAVELDENRKRALTDKKRFEETPITELLKGGKAGFILAQTLLASYQRRMGAKQGVEPGAEMLEAIRAAEASGARVALVDRDIGITLRRAYAFMTFREKLRLSWELMRSMFGADEREELEVEEILQEDVLTAMMAELSAMAPSVAKVLISERDAYLAANILEEAKGGTLVAVLGAGHLKGVESYLRDPATIPDKAPLEVVPKRFPWGKVFGWSVLALLFVIFGVAIWRATRSGEGVGDLITLVRDYVLITGTCAAIGALLARAHPLSILAAFIAAPIAILHPTVASGWISGLVEARMRTPTVGDFQQVSQIQTVGEMFGNRVMRVLLVAALTNVGAMVSVLIVIPYLLPSLF